ncbi:Crp/Fnr family transcriptional regulator [Rhizobium sullae]|uniref:Crp/Fnr family transcriptional regulator n=1 Tax=Rhizobium sullae TaxID=50338 RepID=UPI000B352CC6|nr:Crp/Fnr family transcriptional regulator [Rhizobium sullae]
MSPFNQSTVRNRLLRVLSLESFEALRPAMEAVDLPIRYVLTEANEPSSYVYFIEDGLASIVATSVDDEKVEVGHVGREGLGGYHVLLMADSTPHRTFMQVAGSGIAVPVDLLLQVVDRDKPTRDLLLRYVHSAEVQLAHSALANGRYNIQERLARWLLMSHDRLGRADLPLTHEFLALMLGVRRSGVTNELHILEGIHAIIATRGNVRVLSREKLEEIAGGCYGLPEAEYERLIGIPIKAGPFIRTA